MVIKKDSGTTAPDKATEQSADLRDLKLLAVIHESRNLKQARPQDGQYVDLLHAVCLLLPHGIILNFTILRGGGNVN